MRILLDHQVFSLQNYGGISRYFTELVNQRILEYDIPIKYSNNFYISGIKNVQPFFPNYSWPGKYSMMYLFNQIYAGAEVHQEKYSLYHPTYYDPTLSYLWPKLPLVVTVYDMIHELFPEYFSRFDITRILKAILIKKARRIIAISESTKNDICRMYDIPEDRIDVIYLGGSMSKKNKNQNFGVQLPSRYLLFVGNRNGYKNFTTFVQAIAPIMQEDQTLRLVCAGGGRFTEGEVGLITKNGIQDRVMQKDVSEKHISAYYASALCLVYPSLYEGFGLPILEAFQNECPVVVSNTSSLPEVGGEAVLYFDPYDPISIQKTVQRCLNDIELQKKLIKAGKIRLSNFTWKKTAQNTKDSYVKAL